MRDCATQGYSRDYTDPYGGITEFTFHEDNWVTGYYSTDDYLRRRGALILKKLEPGETIPPEDSLTPDQYRMTCMLEDLTNPDNTGSPITALRNFKEFARYRNDKRIEDPKWIFKEQQTIRRSFLWHIDLDRISASVETKDTEREIE